MLRRRTLGVVLLLSFTASSFASKKEKPKDPPPLSHVGFSVRQFTAPEDYNWRGSEERTLSVIIWYPAEGSTDEKEQAIGDPPLFIAGRAAKDASLAPSFNTYPLIALSHGTGGSALQMAWLGTYLAARGNIVVAVNHPGNNALGKYTPQGFVEWWERARDISTVIDVMLSDRRFGSKIDRDRIGAAGFSLGGYTMMELAGATTDFAGVLTWCETPEHHSACNPPEMPDLVEKFAAMKAQPEVQLATGHAGDSYRDPRIKAVFAIAPAIGKAFSRESLQRIAIPVSIVAGSADDVVPPPDNAQFFAANIKGAQLTLLPGGVGHYTFLDVGTEFGQQKLPLFFKDNPGVDREAVHGRVAEMAAEFFEKQLAPAKKKK
jgi:predicted dienelactone hydrolase